MKSTEEFLHVLEESLSGDLPVDEVLSNLTYYRDYINSQRGSKSEEDIITGLGDPRLIARTIIETYQRNHGTQHYETVDDIQMTRDYSGEQGRKQSERGPKVHTFTMSSKLAGIIGLVILFLILGAVFWIGGVIFKLFIKFVLPILLVGLGITWIIRQIRR